MEDMTVFLGARNIEMPVESVRSPCCSFGHCHSGSLWSGLLSGLADLQPSSWPTVSHWLPSRKSTYYIK